VNELDRDLLTGEQVLFETTKHWFAAIRASLVAILILLGALLLRGLSPSGDGLVGSLGGLMDLISVGLLLVGILWIVYNVGELLSAHFGVTNMRVLRYEGILRRRSSETLLSTLTDVRLVEPAIGRMLGFGDLRILTSSGAAGEDEFKTVRDAKRLRTAIQEQKAAAMTGGYAAAPAGSMPAAAMPAAAMPAAPAAPAAAAPTQVSAEPPPAPAPAAPPPAPTAPAADPAAALAALGDLRTQGLISDAEYEAKRSEILGRL
jgi:Bacterial PH domain/Short C-terminal domain